MQGKVIRDFWNLVLPFRKMCHSPRVSHAGCLVTEYRTYRDELGRVLNHLRDFKQGLSSFAECLISFLASGRQDSLPDGPELLGPPESPVLPQGQGWERICHQGTNGGSGKGRLQGREAATRGARGQPPAFVLTS